jgi:hypothetical protein
MGVSHCPTCRCSGEPVLNRTNCCRNRGYERWPGQPCPEHASGSASVYCVCVRSADEKPSKHTWSKVFGCPEAREGMNLGHRGDELWLVNGEVTPHGRDAWDAEQARRRREPTAASQPAPVAGNYATCAVCGERQSVRKNGQFRQHRWDAEPDTTICPGTARTPVEAGRMRQALDAPNLSVVPRS